MTDQIFLILQKSGQQIGSKFLKPEDLVLNEEYKITSWKIIKTKFGDKLQVSLHEQGLLILPDRMLKALGESGLSGAAPPSGAMLKFLGRDVNKFNACLYDLYVKVDDDDDDNDTFIQDGQIW